MTAPASQGRLARVRENLRGSFWVAPTIGVTLGFAAGLGLEAVPSLPDSFTSEFGWPGDTQSARELLAVLAGSVMTVTTLSFSLTVVSLQLASSQFSPRLLRTFAKDRVIKGTLAVFLGTFAYCIAVLRGIAGIGEDDTPHTAMVGAIVLGIVVTFTLVAFVSHVVRMLRVDSMMAGAAEEARALLERTYPELGSDAPPVPVAPRDAVLLRSSVEGVVQAVTARVLLPIAAERDLCVRIDVVAGDHVVHGAPVGRAWPRREGAARPSQEDLDACVARVLSTGQERTPQQDVAFGFRQIADIAVKAMSPGVNDPTTAVSAVGQLAVLLSHVIRRQVGEQVLCDDDGVPRVVAAQRDMAYLLDLSCGELRRYAAAEPTVLVAILALLRDTGGCTDIDAHKAAVCEQIDLLVRAARRGLDEETDLDAVLQAAWSAREAVAGRWTAPGSRRPRAAEDVSP